MVRFARATRLIARLGQARLILSMPDIEIGQMVGKNRLQELVSPLIHRLRQLGMPLARPAVVQNRDFSGG